MPKRIDATYTDDAGVFFADTLSRYLGASAANQPAVAEMQTRRGRHILVVTKEPTASDPLRLVSIGRTRVNCLTQTAYAAAVVKAASSTIIPNLQGEPLPPIPPNGQQKIASKVAENMFGPIRGT